MMIPFDTNLLKHRPHDLQLPTEAERAAAQMTPLVRQIIWHLLLRLLAFGARHAHLRTPKIAGGDT